MLAEELGVPQKSLLRRTKHHIKPQADLETSQRSKREMSFVAVGKPPGAVLLVDDVYTSGRTMQLAAAELKRAGASRVWGVVLARGD